ncbi:unnamed protein product [Allacma fusca]|uniref:Ion transport domain-containing protein n=1 Tax=Allacma fusca TaxID=39272 RepID=A0A8J2K1J9_9HEXA|nr:unnamed protein product [Allacma fusca]
MKQQRVGPSSTVRKLICCPDVPYYEHVRCFYCSEDSLDVIDHNNHHEAVNRHVKLKVAGDDKSVPQDVCLLLESPFRILRVAESGNVKEFQRLVTNDISKLNVRDSRGRAAVHQATIRNHVSILQVVVTFNGSLNLADNHGNTPLHLAVEFETLDTLEFLLANSADTRILNDKFQSVLHLASEMNKPTALKVLAKYKHSLDPDICGEHGRTPLHVAAINDHEECLKILLYEMGSCPKKCDLFGNFIIHEAAKHASSRSMEILLTWGDSHGCPRSEMISFFDAEGNVPLHSAVHGGDVKAVELCLRSGAKISTQQHDLSTPVHLACSQGAMEMVKLMFQLQPEEKEVCLKSSDMQRMTPLHCAAMFDHHELVEYLISQGASVNVLDKERRSPLVIAASRNGWRTMRVLIRLGAKVDLKDDEFRNALHVLVIHGGDLENIIDEQFSKDFQFILDEKDKYGHTPLHYAAKQGQIKSAAKLLFYGASIITKSNDGENVFHISCRYGRLNIIQQILNMEQNNSVINEGNGKGLTALHIAASEGHSRVVQALMKKGALLHRDHSGETPLHLAAKYGHRHTMKVILNVHSHLLDQTDKEGNTSLHIAAMENRAAAVELLLSLNCNLTNNKKGYSAMDFALQNKFSTVALAMATHPSRGDEILAMTSGKYPSIMLALVATMPHVAQAVLDRCITKSENKTDSELYHIKYDFKWLSLIDADQGWMGSLPSERNEDKYLPERRHLPVLNAMVSYGRVELLSHDLSQKYLQMKWNAYGKYIHIAHLFLYLTYLAALTLYSSDVCDESVPKYYSLKVNHSFTTTSDFEDTTEAYRHNPDGDHHSSELTDVRKCCDNFLLLEIGIALVALFNIGMDIGNVYRQKIKYILDSSNWAFLAMNIASLCMISCRILPAAITAHPSASASLVAFLSWFYLLLFLQRFDVVGIYVVMFLEILHTLLRVLMIFSILIVAFGLAFFILLSQGNHVAFDHIPMSLMKTFSMMLGDMDFMNTFVNPYHCDMKFAADPDLVKELKECELKRRLPHPRVSFLMIGIFMVLMPILLMNLLIGLAVGDIDSVRRNAQLKRLAMQVHLHTTVEKTLPKFILLRVDKKEVVEYPNVSKARLGFIDYLFKYFQPKSTNKRVETVEEEMADEVATTMQQNKATLINVSSRLENIETLVRLLCQKMELCAELDLDEGIQLESESMLAGTERRYRVPKRITRRRALVLGRFLEF